MRALGDIRQRCANRPLSAAGVANLVALSQLTLATLAARKFRAGRVRTRKRSLGECARRGRCVRFHGPLRHAAGEYTRQRNHRAPRRNEYIDYAERGRRPVEADTPRAPVNQLNLSSAPSLPT